MKGMLIYIAPWLFDTLLFNRSVNSESKAPLERKAKLYCTVVKCIAFTIGTQM